MPVSCGNRPGRAAVQRNEWELALRALPEAQDRIGRSLKEIGDKSRDVMLTPKPEMQAIAGKG